MSQMWEKLIEDGQSSLRGCLSLGRVSISKSTGDMCIRLESNRLLSQDEIDQVSSRLSGAFSPTRVVTRVSYAALRDEVLRDPTRALQALRRGVREASPASVPFINWQGGGWTLEDGLLTVCVSTNEALSVMLAQWKTKSAAGTSASATSGSSTDPSASPASSSAPSPAAGSSSSAGSRLSSRARSRSR